MSHKITILVLFTFAALFSCRKEMEVAPKSVQIDTVKLVAVSGKHIMPGRLQFLADTLIAPFAGKVQWFVANGHTVKKGDTIGTISSGIDYRSISNRAELLHIQTRLLQNIGELEKHVANLKAKADNNELNHLIKQLSTYGFIDEKSFNTVKSSNELETLLKIRIQELNKKVNHIAQKHEHKNSQSLYHIVSPSNGSIKIISAQPKVKPGDAMASIKELSKRVVAFNAGSVPQAAWKNGITLITPVGKLEGKIVEQSGKIFILKLLNQTHLVDAIIKKQIKMKLISEPEQKMLITRNAVIKSGTDEMVFRKKGNTFEKIAVTTRFYNGSLVEIISGLHHNDQIIVSSTEPIWDKTHLKITGFYAEN